MKDLFVSYGRRESLVFVGKLHQQLKLAGYDAWFDKVNIPDGDDYAQRISHGIESAHNFAYIMAPRCMTSPYCLVELEYARILGKRIIPVAQIPIFDTPAKELSEADQQVMVDFYKTYAITGVEIKTEADVLKRSHSLLGKTDWIYAREEYTPENIKQLFDWQSNYENFWYKHDDKTYLQTYTFPSFGKSIDDFNGVCESLARVIEKHKSYTVEHTEILLAALQWRSKNQVTEALLVGAERKEAEDWLLKEFVAPEQPPCVPSDLHAEFICESRKNAENLHTDAFVCYDVANKELREKVYKSLSKLGITTWIHHKDIAKSENYEEAIQRGIEQADNLLFFISNDSIESEYCLKELNYALLLNKRVIPLLIEVLTPEKLAVFNRIAKLPQIQYIDFSNNRNEDNYQQDIKELLREVQRDRRYYEQHKVFLVQALKWERQGKNPSILLRGYNLQNAITWLKTAGKRTAQKPTSIQEEFINESAAHAGDENIDVFISYSRNDGDFARRLNEQLQVNGRSTWFDQDSIAIGADFQKEIYKGIANSNNFIFLISHKSVTSPYCADEVVYAEEQGKRIITIRLEAVEAGLLPAALSSIQWIDSSKDKDFNGVFSQLIRTLDLDRTHIESHSKWQGKALEWKKKSKDSALLLRGSEFSVAELWLKESLEQNKQPKPTAVQQEFIEESRKAIEATAAREGKIATVLAKRLKVMRLALGASAFLLFAALVAMIMAYIAKRASDNSAAVAALATENAKGEARRADSLNRISLTTATRLSAFQGETFSLIHLMKLQNEGYNVRDSIRQLVKAIDPINKVLLRFRDGMNKYGFNDTLGNVIIPAFFDEAEEFVNKKAKVRVGEGRYILSPDGTRQIAQETNKMWEWQTVRMGAKPSKRSGLSNLVSGIFGGNKRKTTTTQRTVTENKPQETAPKETAQQTEQKTEQPQSKSKFGKFWRGIVGKKEESTPPANTTAKNDTEEKPKTEPAKEEKTEQKSSNALSKIVKGMTSSSDSEPETDIVEEIEETITGSGKFRIPRNAASATLNPDDFYDKYVMRIRHKDLTQKMWGIEAGLQVGYMTSEEAVCSYDGATMETNTAEVLVLKAPLENFMWADFNRIKEYEEKGWAKLQGGWEESGQPIFITKVQIKNGEYALGKGIKGCALYADGKQEVINCDKYQVLLYKMPPNELLEREQNKAIVKVSKYNIEYLQNGVGKITGLAAEPFADWKWVKTEKPANFKFKIPLNAFELAEQQTDTLQYLMRVHREDGSMYLGYLTENQGNYAYEKILVDARSAEILVIADEDKFEWVEASKKDEYLVEGYKTMQGGWDADGKPFTIVRAKYDGKYHVGQLNGTTCTIVVKQRLITMTTYELLLYKQ